MESGVYHAKQKAPFGTVDRSKDFDAATVSQKHSTHVTGRSSAAGQSLAAQQALRLGQSLKEGTKKAAEAAFRVNLASQTFGSSGQFLI